MNDEYLKRKIAEHTELMEAAREAGLFVLYAFHEGEVNNYKQMIELGGTD